MGDEHVVKLTSPTFTILQIKSELRSKRATNTLCYGPSVHRLLSLFYFSCLSVCSLRDRKTKAMVSTTTNIFISFKNLVNNNNGNNNNNNNGVLLLKSLPYKTNFVIDIILN